MFSRWKQSVTDLSARTRQTVAFGPGHPAVRAAKRYCDRTGETWEIGIGGRCELGKRAFKQWWHEADLKQRWLVVALPIVAVVVLLALISPRATLSALIVVGTAAYLLVGLGLGMMMSFNDTDGESIWHDHRPWARACVWGFILTAPVAFVAYGIGHGISWLDASSKKTRKLVLRLLGGVALAVLFWLFTIIILRIGWWAFLIGVAEVVAVVALIVGTLALVIWAVMAYRRHVAAARLSDAALQRSERDRLEPLLRAYYDEAHHWATLMGESEMSYEAWCDELEKRLARANLGWQDLVSEYPFLRLERVELKDSWFSQGSYYFKEDLDTEWRRRKLEAATQRCEHGVVGFVLATLFLAKTRVCPNVILPKWEDVKA